MPFNTLGQSVAAVGAATLAFAIAAPASAPKSTTGKDTTRTRITRDAHHAPLRPLITRVVRSSFIRCWR